MSSDNPRHDEAVEPLLQGLRQFEKLGISRPASASLNEFVEALIAREIVPRSLGEEMISEYHNRRFGHSPDDQRLERILADMRRATADFESLAADKRAAIVEQLNGQFRPKITGQRTPVEPRVVLPAAITSEPVPEMGPLFPDETAEPPADVQPFWSGKAYWSQKAVLRMIIAVATLWTLGVLIGGYIVHDRLDVVVAKVRATLGFPSPEPLPERVHAAREDWRSPQKRRSEMLWEMANQFHKRNLAREALYAYHLTLYYDPSNSDVMNGLAWLLLTSTDKSVLDAARALPLAKRAVEGNPSIANLDTLAEALYQSGDFEQALSVEERAMDAGKDTEHREHLARQLDKFRSALASKVDAEPKSRPDAAASPPAARPGSGTPGAAVSNAEPISLPRLEPPPPPLPE